MAWLPCLLVGRRGLQDWALEAKEPPESVVEVMDGLRVPCPRDDALAQRRQHIVQRQSRRVGRLESAQEHDQVCVGGNARVTQCRRRSGVICKSDCRHRRGHRHRTHQRQVSIVLRIELRDRRRGSTTLRPADRPERCPGIHGKMSGSVDDVDGIAGVRPVDDVLMHAVGSEALVIRGADDPSGVDEALQPRNAIVDLLRRLRGEVGDELAGRVGLEGWAGGITEACRAVAPRDDRPAAARVIRSDHEAGGLVLSTVHIAR